MTTYDEISACPFKNREFWSERARMFLALYRQHRTEGNTHEAFWQRKNFISTMRDRRLRRFLGQRYA